MNREIIQNQMRGKIGPCPYFPPIQEIFQVRTDVDEQPYHRFFRGRPDSDRPVIWDREAGYSRIRAQTTTPRRTAEVATTPSTCFQVPCSTVLPCRRSDTTPALSSTDGCVFTSP
jgi:hypothetical protein